MAEAEELGVGDRILAGRSASGRGEKWHKNCDPGLHILYQVGDLSQLPRSGEGDEGVHLGLSTSGDCCKPGRPGRLDLPTGSISRPAPQTPYLSLADPAGQLDAGQQQEGLNGRRHRPQVPGAEGLHEREEGEQQARDDTQQQRKAPLEHRPGHVARPSKGQTNRLCSRPGKRRDPRAGPVFMRGRGLNERRGRDYLHPRHHPDLLTLRIPFHPTLHLLSSPFPPINLHNCFSHS
eukprot:g37070.t1